MRIRAACLLPLLLVGCLSDLAFYGLGQEIGEGLKRTMTYGVLIGCLRGIGDPGDLVCAPGDPGYIWELPTVGVQRHYYGSWTGFTMVFGLVLIGDEVEELHVATYYGQPQRDRAPDEVWTFPLHTSILIVRIIDGNGKRRGGVNVNRRSMRTVDGSSCDGSRWAEDGEERYADPAGTYELRCEGCVRGRVTLKPLQMVVCTLGPDGLVVVERSEPWDPIPVFEAPRSSR